MLPAGSGCRSREGLFIGFLVVLALGCEEGPRQGSIPAVPLVPASPVVAPPAAPPAVPRPAPPPPATVVPAAAAAPATAPAATGTTADNTTREKAEVGAGEKGRSLKYELGTTSAKVYFAARERVVFEIQIPEAMKLYKATNGAAPKDQAAFMRDIIQANSISLPELPSGHKYVYDAQLEELQVEHPRGQ